MGDRQKPKGAQCARRTGIISVFFPPFFSNLRVALVGNFVFRQKRIFGGRKRILRPPRTIPVAILLVEICNNQYYTKKMSFINHHK
jgi:hypothetical protein